MSMTVQELLERLGKMKPEAKVRFEDASGETFSIGDMTTDADGGLLLIEGLPEDDSEPTFATGDDT